MAIFHVAGTVEVSIDRLRMWHKGIEIYSLQSFNIPGDIYQIIRPIISPWLTVIFNQSFRTGIFPDEWKLANVFSLV